MSTYRTACYILICINEWDNHLKCLHKLLRMRFIKNINDSAILVLIFELLITYDYKGKDHFMHTLLMQQLPP